MKHHLELDGIRGLAILLVIIWHYTTSQIIINPGPSTAIIAIAGSLTWSGVDLFFVLSGYLLGSILIQNQTSASYFKTFYIKRICRIFPLYYSFLIIYLLSDYFINTQSNSGFRWLFDNSMPFWSYATYTQNIFMALYGTSGAHFLGITWSLAVEEQFYLVLPFIIRYVRGILLPILLIAIIASAPFIRLFLFSKGIDAFVLSIARTDSLVMGVLLAYLMENKKTRAYLMEKKHLLHFIFGIFFAGFLLLTGANKMLGVFNHLWLAFLYTTLIAIVVIDKKCTISALARNPLLVRLGIISYSVYLLHQPVSGMLHAFITNQLPSLYSLDTLYITSSSLILVIILSSITYRFIEKPFLRIGSKYSY